MMKKLGELLFSMTTAVVLMSVFAMSIAWATFVESDFGTETAKKLVYGATWFEILLFLIVVNIAGNVFKYKLFTRKKWTILLFHFAFIFIIAGGGITRFFGNEGTMHIREGASSDEIVLSSTFLTLEANYKGLTEVSSKKVRLTNSGSNHYSQSVTIGGRKVKLETELYIPNASEIITESETGVPAISLFVMESRKTGNEFDLMLGENMVVEGVNYSFNAESPGNITFAFENGVPQFISNNTVLLTGMMNRDTVVLEPGTWHELKAKTIYRSSGQIFVMKSFLPHAAKSIVSNSEAETGIKGLVVSLSTDNGYKRVSLINRGGEALPVETRLDDMDVKVWFGSKTVKVPFSLALNDFILERYPGSNSPSSYASEVVLNDPANNKTMPYRIFMNHTLKYGGYRFFQSSYDRDEKGTILSVSHDYWGTFVSYLGYLLMGIGMVLTLFNKNSRIRLLLRQSAEVRKSKRNALATFLLLFVLTPAFSQGARVTDKQHLKELNSLLVQDRNGRIEPLISMTSEVMRKIYKKESYKGMSSAEVVMGMLYNPLQWQSEPMLKISNAKLAQQIGSTTGYVSYQSLFANGKYALQKLVEETYHKEPNKRDKYDKEVLNLDERVNICYQIYNGTFLKLFPIPDDPNFTWTAPHTFPVSRLSNPENSPVALYNAYLKELAAAHSSGNWNRARDLLVSIKAYQLQNSGGIIPSGFRIRMEVFYSRANIFGKLSMTYMVVGLLLLLLNLISIFKPKVALKGVGIAGLGVASFIFAIYTAGIALRWYISGHAPWSNGYETMVFVGWATALAGILFSRQSSITLAVTNLLAGIMLMVAGMSWMNPEITPLVPVLKSYWLILHVAIITSSYGFLAIGALLGMLNLFLVIFRSKANNARVSLHIKEITIIIEISLIIGLILLTAGSFLGGIWANESWGRYWGWDPKETWALVTILVYSVVLHLRKIPGVSGVTLFNGLALASFASVLMTFFGVNYYLSGLHSYAQGDTPPVPTAVYFSVVLVIVLVVAAWFAEKNRAVK